MFPYDPTLLDAVQSTPQTIADVIEMMQTIDATCVPGDGLKWFNWLYLNVTQAVQTRVNIADPADPDRFADPAWIAALDVAFARFYFTAVEFSLSGEPAPDCWQALFAVRNQTSIARIQFALAGMNAHINHDLQLAILGLCQSTSIAPQHGTTQYNDYTALNATLDSLIEAAKITLRVRLLGDALPPISALDNTLAAFSVAAAREAAWNNSELLWHLDSDAPPLAAALLDTLDGLTALAGKTLLVPVD